MVPGFEGTNRITLRITEEHTRQLIGGTVIWRELISRGSDPAFYANIRTVKLTCSAHMQFSLEETSPTYLSVEFSFG